MTNPFLSNRQQYHLPLDYIQHKTHLDVRTIQLAEQTRFPPTNPAVNLLALFYSNPPFSNDADILVKAYSEQQYLIRQSLFSNHYLAPLDYTTRAALAVTSVNFDPLNPPLVQTREEAQQARRKQQVLEQLEEREWLKHLPLSETFSYWLATFKASLKLTSDPTFVLSNDAIAQLLCTTRFNVTAKDELTVAFTDIEELMDTGRFNYDLSLRQIQQLAWLLDGLLGRST